MTGCPAGEEENGGPISFQTTTHTGGLSGTYTQTFIDRSPDENGEIDGVIEETIIEAYSFTGNTWTTKRNGKEIFGGYYTASDHTVDFEVTWFDSTHDVGLHPGTTFTAIFSDNNLILGDNEILTKLTDG